MHCVILTGDFNCRSNQWWAGCKNLHEGMTFDDLFESCNMTKLIEQSTNIEPRGISCVDLIVIDQPNLFIDHGIHSSIDNCCHHQIIYGKLNYPSPYRSHIKDKFGTLQKLE